jgi:hypothetical protein
MKNEETKSQAEEADGCGLCRVSAADGGGAVHSLPRPAGMPGLPPAVLALPGAAISKGAKMKAKTKKLTYKQRMALWAKALEALHAVVAKHEQRASQKAP